MKNLSELKDNEFLLVCTSNNFDGNVVTKSDFINDLEYYENKSKTDSKFEVYTTKKYHAQLDAKYILDNALENESQDMYEDWYEAIWNDVEEQDVKDIQDILDRILARNSDSNISYTSDEQVDINS
jgi:hypothetical protein